MINIDPLYLFDGLAPMIISIFLVLFWRLKRSLKWIALAYALLAYGGAIALKYAIQIPTINSVIGTFGSHSPELALYYGLQTSVLEVGGAYLVALYAVKKKNLGLADCASYGISLSFWENGILLGLFTFVSLLLDYLIIGSGGVLGGVVYDQLMKTSPALFYGPAQAWFLVILSVLERISSLLAHVAWGILTLLAATTRRRRYFYIALPMGMIDAMVPYSSMLGLAAFESLLFGICISFLIIAVFLETRVMWQGFEMNGE